MQEAFGALGFTPEMSTCQTASASTPTTSGSPRTASSGFDFPDDEALIQAEFEKNIPFALAVAQSAVDPDDPVSVGRRRHPGLPSSTASPCPTATRRPWPSSRSAPCRGLKLNFRINGGRTRTDAGARVEGRRALRVRERRLLRRVPRRGEGRDVRVTRWRCGSPRSRPSRRQQTQRGSRASTSRTRSQSDSGRDVLVIANEDYTGVNPDPPGTTAPSTSTSTSTRSTPTASQPDVWDVDAQGVPHDLGVLEPLPDGHLVPRRRTA